MTRSFRQAMTVAAAVFAATGGLAACSSSAASTTPGAQSITLYSGQHEQTADGLVTAFEKQTGITVNVRSDDEDTLANLIAVQGSHSPADVFYTENSPPLEFLQEKGCCPRWIPARWPTHRPGTTHRRATGSGCLPGSASSSTTRR